jgi:hypothetical protein
MTPASGRLLFVALLALAAAACQTEDLPPQPHFVSVAYDQELAVAQPSKKAARSGVLTAQSSQNSDRRYFIEFRSRYALSYGHTYAIFGRANQAGGMIDPEVAGLHPASNSEIPYVLGHFVPVPAETGWSDGDLEEEYRSASWRVMLNEAEYKKIVSNIRKLQASSTTWNATFYNCNAFVANIARSMGYKTPSKWLRPQQFITKLREMNS